MRRSDAKPQQRPDRKSLPNLVRPQLLLDPRTPRTHGPFPRTPSIHRILRRPGLEPLHARCERAGTGIVGREGEGDSVYGGERGYAGKGGDDVEVVEAEVSV